MKFDEIVEIIEKIKDPCKKRDVLTRVTLVLKKQLGVLNEMWGRLDMDEEDNGEG